MPSAPSRGSVTSNYGPRKGSEIGPGVGPFHFGEDTNGDGNYSPDSGTIVFAGYAGNFGNAILVRSGDVVWNLAHHANLNGRRVGQVVREQERLAPMGATGLAFGVHVHTERRVGGGNAIQSGAHTNPRNYYSAPASSGAAPIILKPQEDNQMSYTVSWNGHILTFAPEMVKHETSSAAAQFMANLTTVDDKVIGIDDAQISALCDSYGIPWYAVEKVIAGGAYNPDGSTPGHFWSRQVELRVLVGRIPTTAPMPDVPTLAKALKEELGDIGGASLPQIEAALKKLVTDIADEQARRMAS